MKPPIRWLAPSLFGSRRLFSAALPWLVGLAVLLSAPNTIAFQVLVDLNTYLKYDANSVSDVQQLKCDGVWTVTGGNDLGTFTLAEWGNMLNLLGPWTVSEDNPNGHSFYDNTVAAIGRRPNDAFCYNEFGPPGDTTLTDPQIMEQAATHNGNVVVLTRAYEGAGGTWATQLDRAFNSPQVVGGCLESVDPSTGGVGGFITDCLSKGKRAYVILVVQTSPQNNATNNTQWIKYQIQYMLNTVPTAMASTNVLIVIADYNGNTNRSKWYGPTNCMQANVAVAKSMAGTPRYPIVPVQTNDLAITTTIAGRPNLALASGGSTAFASSSLSAAYGPGLVNNGINNNTSNAWIAATVNNGEYVGVAFPSPVTLGSIVFDGETGYDYRSGVTWSLQYTTHASPGTGTTNWTQIGSGTYTWTSTSPMPRLYFEFPRIFNVTGIRLVCSNVLYGQQPCVQELEAYAPASTISPVAVGDTNVNAIVNGRSNFALASSGTTAFASSSLSAAYGPALVNNGINNNTSNAWIAATAADGEYVGVAFPCPVTLGSIVFDGETEYGYRSASTWSLQYTTNALPGTNTPASAWTQIGNYTWVSTNPMPRLYFEFPTIPNVTGIRLVSTNVLYGEQPCIQELEAYGSPFMIPTAAGDTNVTSYIAGRPNLALASGGGTAFASSSLNSSYLPSLVNNGINDGSTNAWIAGTTNNGEYVGIAFASPKTLGAIVFAGEIGYDYRSASTWSLQYATASSPGTNTPASAWTQIGTYTWVSGVSMPRLYFEFSTISNVTGIRLVSSKVLFGISGVQQCIQELEAYETLPAISPAAVGDTNVTAMVAGRTNWALASGGATAFASSSLSGYGPALANDGNFGGTPFIIGTPGATEYLAIALPTNITLAAVAWQGWYGNRSVGSYLLEYTQDAIPGMNTANWTAIGRYDFPLDGPYGSVMPRSYFQLAAPISNVTGIRLVFQSTYWDNMDIQEIEAYMPPVPAISPAAVGGANVTAMVAGRTNWALASGGATAFASSSLGGYGPALANDGNFSGTPFIVGTAGVTEYLAIAFPTNITLTAVAWQGWFGNRSVGSYRLEYTTSAAPNTNTTSWTAIGRYDFPPDGPFGSVMPRSYFQLAAPIANVTGVRLVFQNTYWDPLDVQEFEAYGQTYGQQSGSITISGHQATTVFWGITGYPYVIQRSTNLADWVVISTNTAPASGAITNTDAFSDLIPAPPPYPRAAFYRLLPH